MTDAAPVLAAFVRERARLSQATDAELLHQPLRDLIDSVDMIDLLAFLEQTFAIAIDDDDVSPETFETTATAAAFVAAKVSAQVR